MHGYQVLVPVSKIIGLVKMKINLPLTPNGSHGPLSTMTIDIDSSKGGGLSINLDTMPDVPPEISWFDTWFNIIPLNRKCTF